MATLIKRRNPNGTIGYRVQDRTTGYPSTSKTFPTLKLAREFKRKLEAERAEGSAGIRRGRQTLAVAVADYTQTADFRNRKDRKHAESHLQWWVDSMGNLPLAKITPDLIANHLHQLESGGRTGSTVNRYRSALSGLFRYAVKTRHWTDHNPCAMVERRQEGKPRERVIRPAEWQRLLKACDSQALLMQESGNADSDYSPRVQIRNFLIVLYGTAARKGDANKLRWEYVDLDREQVTFHNPKAGTAYTVPLMGDALEAIKEQHAKRIEGSPWVFPTPTGQNKPTNFEEAFKRVRADAGLAEPDVKGEVLVMHSLRHSAATEAGKAGASAFEVQAMTGHKTLAMVSRYTKVDVANAAEAMRKRWQA
jgi:integrase